MKHKTLFVVLATLAGLSFTVSSGFCVGPYYEEYFTGGTTDIVWHSAWTDSVGNELTPMLVDSVAGNPSGDGWIGDVVADTASLGGIGLALAGDDALNDYIMEAQIWVDPDAGYYEGMMVRVHQDTTTGVTRGYQLVSNFYSPFGISQVKFRYYVSIPDSIRDIRVYDSSEIPGGAPTVAGWHLMKIKAKGDKFWLYWDGQEFPGNPQVDTAIPNGFFGIYTFSFMGLTETLSDDIIVRPATLTLDDPSPGIAGQNNTLTAGGASPGSSVWFVYGFQQGSTNVPTCSGETVGISNPNIIGASTADSQGIASITTFVPGAASGLTVHIQAVELSACMVSNLVTYTFP